VQPATSAKQEFDRLEDELSAQQSLDAVGFAVRVEVPFAELGSYDPINADGMAVVQGSALALNQKELAALSKQGFVVSGAHQFPTFAKGGRGGPDDRRCAHAAHG
jgi:hypothetical protein